MQMQNLFVSFMRTLVPIVAGLVLGAAARIGLDLDDATTAAYVTAALTAGYYALFRAVEELAERMAWQPLQLLAGVLLGWARPPQYVQPVTAPVRLQLDKAAMRQDISDFVRRLDSAARDRGPR
ncbi:hypothetical protein [Streptomyces adelaidensis]|uniref:hypothetical protein n=1 Tax=Streptomyces adelaidensis TaxID=2796465 RepID=UPI001904FDD6|nr:hypothetical protein [Streptomyces adelaidensis]